DLDQAPRAVDPRGRGRLAARGKPALAVVGQPLKEQEVAPLVVDAEEAPRKTDPLEPVLLEYPLRGEIVDQSRRLDAMEGELVERVREDLADRAAREPSPVARVVDPVADRGALQGLPDDVEEVDRAGDRLAVEDR